MNIYQEVTQKIIDALRKGVGPWIKPWRFGAHKNAVNGRPYRGINVLLLNLRATEEGFESPLWVTFRNAQKLGGHVRKGEKGTRIIFWKIREVTEFDEDQQEKKKTSVFGCSYVVFNVEQCEGLDLKQEEKEPDPPKIAEAEEILKLADIRFGGPEAFYNRQLDRISLPARKTFKAPGEFYATSLHEMTHWTGHESRLNREFGKRFGDRAYAFEELVAETGSAFLCTRLGLPTERLQHSEYIGVWVKALENDNKAIFTAARKAQEACDYLLDAVQSQARLKEAA